MNITRAQELRFWSLVSPSNESGCRLWLACTFDGYGRFGVGSLKDGTRGVAQAHRVAWELSLGIAVPPGMLVCHRCDVRACVEPTHLFLGTSFDNLNDMSAKGRGSVGRYPYGVRFNPTSGKFRAQVVYKNRSRYFGSYNTPQEASAVAIEERKRLREGGMQYHSPGFNLHCEAR